MVAFQKFIVNASLHEVWWLSDLQTNQHEEGMMALHAKLTWNELLAKGTSVLGC